MVVGLRYWGQDTAWRSPLQRCPPHTDPSESARLSGARVTPGPGGGSDPITASEALRTALRLGESALVVGEVRGEEARVLYEAMRVGAGGAAVLGTIHGEGGGTVRERVVDDLGVPASAFAETDLVVTVSARETVHGRDRRVTRIEEVRRDRGSDHGGDGTRFAPLFERTAEGLAPTDRLREDSTLVADMTPPDGSNEGTLTAIGDRAAAFGGDGRPFEIDRSEAAGPDPGTPVRNGREDPDGG
jgi:hypothetical protein